MMRRTAFFVACLAGALPVLADDIVVPIGYAATPGTSTFLGQLANAQRTYQWLIHADQLTALVGQDLTGIAYRNPTSATVAWPAAATVYSSYDIYLGASVLPSERSLTFAQNVAGPQTPVRAGALTIDPETYGFGSSPNAFGPTIQFDVPYTYTGGHLLIELRHTGMSGTSRSVDAIGTATTGYGTQFSAAWTGNYTGTSGSQGNFAVIQISYTSGSLCYANCDGSTVEPVLNIDDFTCFINEFASAQSLPPEQQLTHYANCDGSTVPPVLNIDDFTCFINAFAQGCP